jgi:hypothetical protein
MYISVMGAGYFMKAGQQLLHLVVLQNDACYSCSLQAAPDMS